MGGFKMKFIQGRWLIFRAVCLAVACALCVSLIPSYAIGGEAEALEPSAGGDAVGLTPGWTQIGSCEWMVEGDGCLVIRPLGGGAHGEFGTDEGSKGFVGALWSEDASSIRAIEISGSVSATSLKEAFCYCENLENISGLANLDVSKARDLSYAFAHCGSMCDLSPLRSWDTSQVENMDGVFWNCVQLGNVDGLVNWDTSKVSTMAGLFQSCTKLSSISGLRKWNVANTRRMDGMFKNTAITDVDALGEWDTSSLEEISYIGANSASMFENCRKLKNVDGLKNWDVSNVHRHGMAWLFSGCSELSDVSGLANWDMSGICSIVGMFEGCSSLQDASPLANWDLSGIVGWMDVDNNLLEDFNIFSGCPLTKIAFGPKWRVTEKVGLWNPVGGGLTGKWVSVDALNSGPLTSAQLTGSFDPATMAGVWVAQRTDGYASVAGPGRWVRDPIGWWYKLEGGGYPHSGLYSVGGKSFLFGPDGYMLTGWQRVGGAWRYFAPGNGDMATGWVKVGPKWFYTDADGVMRTGWNQVDGSWYYLRPGNGDMATGWVKVDCKWFYLDGAGVMRTGWQKVGGTWYYLRPGNGDMATGWIQLSGKWYYLDGAGAMQIGWRTVGGARYYFDATGAMVVNSWVGGSYVGPDGAVVRTR